VLTVCRARGARFGQYALVSGGFGVEVVPAPRYQRVIDRITVPLSRLLSLLTLEPPERRSSRDNFRVIVRNPRGEWRALRIASADEAKRVRDETQARIERIGIEAWSREMRGRIPESVFR
jgi:hypothetical protein